ncbi:MAG: DUF1565 domain-containing protein [Chitinophagaceae bacterium]
MTFITATTLAGTFNTINGLSPGWTIHYNSPSTGMVTLVYAAPTTYYVNNGILDASDVYTTGIGNDANPGTQAAPFATIQKAIAVAGASNTIYVDAGTYTEIGQLLINKNLTIIGATKTTTIIKPAQNTGSTDDDRGWFLVNTGKTFNLSKVTLDGTGHLIRQGIRHKGNGVIMIANSII